jgi:hypothetical protein
MLASSTDKTCLKNVSANETARSTPQGQQKKYVAIISSDANLTWSGNAARTSVSAHRPLLPQRRMTSSQHITQFTSDDAE